MVFLLAYCLPGPHAFLHCSTLVCSWVVECKEVCVSGNGTVYKGYYPFKMGPKSFIGLETPKIGWILKFQKLPGEFSHSEEHSSIYEAWWSKISKKNIKNKNTHCLTKAGRGGAKSLLWRHKDLVPFNQLWWWVLDNRDQFAWSPWHGRK